MFNLVVYFIVLNFTLRPPEQYTHDGTVILKGGDNITTSKFKRNQVKHTTLQDFTSTRKGQSYITNYKTHDTQVYVSVARV